MVCQIENCHLNREQRMIKFEGGHCDPCIEPIVRALNAAGLKTVASCCGHKMRPGNIALADGREIIIAQNFDEGRLIDTLFRTDINGEPL